MPKSFEVTREVGSPWWKKGMIAGAVLIALSIVSRLIWGLRFLLNFASVDNQLPAEKFAEGVNQAFNGAIITSLLFLPGLFLLVISLVGYFLHANQR